LNKILKKSTGSVRFRFYKLETEITELNRTITKKIQAKPEKTEPNRFFLQNNQTEPKPVGLNLFRFSFEKNQF
jgi:hypothetical protein